MNNYVSSGKVLTLTAPSGDVVAGVLYKIGSLIVLATVSAAETEKFAAQVTGEILAEKTTGQTWDEGEKLYYVSGTKKLSTSSGGGNTLCGVATAAAGSSDTTGKARLDGVAR